MRNTLQSISLVKGPAPFLSTILVTAERHINAMGLTLAVVDSVEFMAINRAYLHKRWYPLHDHYGHDRFLGLIASDAKTGEVAGTIAARPADLDGRSLGQAFEDLRFVYPAGVPIGVKDRFAHIPRAAYAIRGNAWYMGGFWLNPDIAPATGLSGSDLLSYLTRACYAIILGTEDPDYSFSIVVDELLRGRERARSVADRYGFRHAAMGPTWINHYPDAEEKNLKINITWMCRAAMMQTLDETPWIGAAWEEAVLEPA
jgi:hypothetical protein